MTDNLHAQKHEEATVRAFIVRDKQDRVLSFLTNPKNRKKITGELSHFRWLDRRFATPVKWKANPALKLWARYEDGNSNLLEFLRSKGAGPTCWVVSEIAAIDGQELQLELAIETVSGSGMGTILSCIPGKLAYFEDEDECLLLIR